MHNPYTNYIAYKRAIIKREACL